MNNPTLDPVDSIPFDNLMIQTDGPDKKAPEVSTTPIPPPEQGAVGTATKDGQTKLDVVPKEEEEQVARELKMQLSQKKVTQTQKWMDPTIHFWIKTEKNIKPFSKVE